MNKKQYEIFVSGFLVLDAMLLAVILFISTSLQTIIAVGSSNVPVTTIATNVSKVAGAGLLIGKVVAPLLAISLIIFVYANKNKKNSGLIYFSIFLLVIAFIAEVGFIYNVHFL
jgi:hypothetical protein